MPFIPLHSTNSQTSPQASGLMVSVPSGTDLIENVVCTTSFQNVYYLKAENAYFHFHFGSWVHLFFTIFSSLKKPHACIFWSFPKGKQFSFPVNQEESLQFDICEWHMQSCLQHNIVPR
jgi:hypothetical protein